MSVLSLYQEISGGADASESSTARTATYTSNISTGDLMIAMWATIDNGAYNITISDSGSNVWTTVVATSASNRGLGIAWAKASSGTNGTKPVVTFGKGGSPCGIACGILAVSGETAQLFDGAAVVAQQTTTVGNVASITTNAQSFTDCLVLAGVASAHSAYNTLTPTSGYTASAAGADSTGIATQLAISKKFTTTSGTNTPGWTVGIHDASIAIGAIVIQGATTAPTIVSATSLTPQDTQQVTFTGQNFGASAGTVTIGGISQGIVSWSNTSVTVTVTRGTNAFGVALNTVLTTSASVVSNTFVGISLTPKPGWAYVNLLTVNGSASLRVSAVADVTSGDQVAYDAQSGNVVVANDGTFSVAPSVTLFSFEVWTTGSGWGASALEVFLAGKVMVPKAWTITPSFDGRLWSQYPTGNKPGGNPIILYTDFISGPTTGGENNLGAYLSLFGYNLGKFSDWGVTNHVTIGGVEVANYRCLTPATGSGLSDKRGVYETLGIMRLSVQVGALGSPTAGTALNIAVTVNGRTMGNPTSGGQFLDYAWGKPLTFTPQPGPIIFLDPVSGNDANAGTFASPKQHMQDSTAFGAGAIKCGSSSSDTTGTKPGTHIYLRGGTYSPTGTTSTGNYGMWANFFRVSGTAPTGATNRGPICITSYPGAAGSNSPELASYVATNGTNTSGGFLGNDQARSSGSATETNPFDGLAGWGRYIHISNVKITCAPDAPRDGAPFNLNSSADYWRVVNNQASWNSTTTGAAGAKAAGLAGNGLHVLAAGNWFHDINGDTAANQNHGFYIDGSAVCANDVWVAFNCVQNIGAGNGIQSYNSQAAGTIQNVYVHNNWIETVQKHGLNQSDNTATRYDWNNIVLFCGEAGVHFSAGSISTSNAMQVFNNVFYGWGRVLSARPGAWNDGGTGAGGNTYIRNNIFFQPAGYPTAGGFTNLDGSGSNTLLTNCYYDANGSMTAPSADTSAVAANPKFNGANVKDFTLQSTSPCINAGVTPVTARAFDFTGNIITNTPDIGAFEFGAHL